MTTASQVLATAAGEIGYCRWDDPEAGTKYGRWYAQRVGSSYYGESGVPYCAMFVSWVLCRCGYDFVYAYCPYILRDYAGRAVAKHLSQPGDIVLFDWGSDGVPDHVGLVEANRGSYIQTIEGNTSRGTGGSQGNGGWVARRTRSLSVVRAIVRPDYDNEEDEVKADDINAIANAVWNFEQNGTLMRDRVQGTDEAANAARAELFRLSTWDEGTHASPLGNLVVRMPVEYPGPDGEQTTEPLGDRVGYIDQRTHAIEARQEAIEAKLDAIIEKLG